MRRGGSVWDLTSWFFRVCAAQRVARHVRVPTYDVGSRAGLDHTAFEPGRKHAAIREWQNPPTVSSDDIVHVIPDSSGNEEESLREGPWLSKTASDSQSSRRLRIGDAILDENHRVRVVHRQTGRTQDLQAGQ